MFNALAKCTDINTPDLILTYLDSVSYAEIINHNQYISCVITTEELLPYLKRTDIGIVLSLYPKYSFFSIHNNLVRRENKSEQIITKGENCRIASSVLMLANIIEIGDNVVIEDNVIIKGNVVIGSNSLIRAGAIIGSASFENCRTPSGAILNIDEVGKILIGENVEIGEYAIIDNAVFSWDNTIIGDYSYIGPRSIIGHGCKLASNVTIKHACTIAGFVSIGANSILSPGCIVKNRLQLSENSRISLGAVVSKNTKPYVKVTGNLAIEHEKLLRILQKIEKE